MLEETLLELQRDVTDEYEALATSLEKELQLTLDIIILRYETNSSVFSPLHLEALKRMDELEATQRSIKRILRKRSSMRLRYSKIITEGDVPGSTPIDNTPTIAVAENLEELAAPVDISMASDMVVPVPLPLTDKGLQDYLRRPVLLDTFSIVTSGTPSVELQVWDLITTEPSVRSKIRNFAFMRADLHVKVVISGSPFHRGKLIVSYQPYPLRNDALQGLLTSRAISSSFTPLVRAYLSQAKGAKVMDVKENVPYEITCPFIATKPMNRLFNSSSSALSAATSYADFENFGSLFIEGLNPVESVSATPSEVVVFVYGWLEDVSLSGLTGTHLEITTEGKVVKKKGENQSGPVQWVTSKLVSISKALTYVPELAPYAMASQMMFEGLGKFASVFGWSRPTQDNTISYMKNVWYSSGASCQGHDTAFRLSLEPSQELTVDTSPFGTSNDEMTIVHISSISSYWRTFTWDPADIPLTTSLQLIPIFPYLSTVHVSVSDVYLQPTAMCYAATPFQYWRGDIVITLQIVASAFHRGKFAVYYEPNPWQNVLIDGFVETNKQYIEIVDIQEVQDISFTVKWNCHRDWLQNPGKTNYRYPGITLASVSEYVNGYVGIVPITGIQSPDDSAIEINVFVSCPNLQVNGFLSVNMPLQRDIVTEGSLVKDPVLQDLNSSASDGGDICFHNFGERPVSFRTLLKRFVTHYAVLGSTQASRTYLLFTEAIYPDPSPKFDATAVTSTTLYSYLRYAYLGMRGSMRRRYRQIGPSSTISAGDSAYITLAVPTSSHLATPTVSQGTVTATELVTYCGSNSRGTVVSGFNASAGIEVDIPHYSPNFFCFSCAAGLVGTNNTDEMNNLWFRNIEVAFMNFSGSSTAPGIASDIATGEDFTMFHFLGAPFWSYPNV